MSKTKTETKLKNLDGMKKAVETIILQAWERGYKYGLHEAEPTIIEEAIDILYDEGWIQRHDKELLESRWTPIKIRELTEEERKENDECICFMFDCPMPEDEQEILISTKYGVEFDTCYFDEGYYLDSGRDWDEVHAWMPLPEPYKGADK